MADDFPDLHHKLCKKLAHLITAFYHLNSKSDETDRIIRNTVETYEDEIDKVVKAANSLIEKTIKESAQGVELLEIREAYIAFKDKTEEERKSAMKEFNVFKESMNEKEKFVREHADKQVDMYKDEVEGMKEKLWHMQKLVEKVVGSEIKFDENELKEKEAEHLKVKNELEERNKELGELKMRYLDIERAYKELEDLHAISDKLTTNYSRELNDNGESLEWENELFRKKIMEQERIIMGLRKAIGQENGLYDADDAASIEYGGSSVREADLQKELMDSQRLIKEREMEIEKLKSMMGDESLQVKIEEYEDRMKEAAREHRKLIETLHSEYSENMAEMEAHMENDRKRWEAIIEGMRTTLDSRNEYIAGLEERLKSLEDMMNEEAQKSSRNKQNEAALNQEIIRLNLLLADSKKDMNAEREKAKNELESLKEEFRIEKEKAVEEQKKQLSKIRELEAEIERLQDVPSEKLEAKAREMAEEYQNKVNELSKRHNLMIRELIEKHDEKVDHINKNYEIELEEIRKELRQEKELVLKMKDEDKHSEISNVKKEYEATLQKISKSLDLQLEEKAHEYETVLRIKDLENLELRKEIAKAKEDLKDEMERLDKKMKSYKEIEKIVKEQNDTIEALQEELEDRQGGDGGLSYRTELKKLTEGGYINEDKDKILRDHLKYAKNMEKRFIDLKKQCEERVGMLIEKYNELVDIFEKRPSRSEDLALIRQLQEEGLERDEEVKRMPEKGKSTSQQAIPSTISSSKIKKPASKTTGPEPAPANATTVLPPISVSQFAIHMRSPPASNGLMASKKFFK